MKNKKGFVMNETLVVIVFLVIIFTFIYVSIVPLIGTYEGIIERNMDVDILYKLYHVRKMLFSDPNKSIILDDSIKSLTCDDFTDHTYCNELIRFLELADYAKVGENTYVLTEPKYKLVYVNDIYDNLEAVKSIDYDMWDYIRRYQKQEGQYLILIDLDSHAVGHLLYENEEP